MTEATTQIERLKIRPDFLAAAQAMHCARGAIVAQARARRDETPTIRVGFTATKRIGNAVARNRAKRRLRAVAAAVLPLSGQERTDYVLVARPATLNRPFDDLLKDLAAALAAAHLKLSETKT